MKAFLGLGSNLGDRTANLVLARGCLARIARPGSLRSSHIYETRPWGRPDQPDYVNAVVTLETQLSPRTLLRLVKECERRAGRPLPAPGAEPPEDQRWGPRVLDIDLLDVGGLVLHERGLILPHPRIAQRAFVLVPLCEIEPAWRNPLTGRTATEMLAALDPEPGDVRLLGRFPESAEEPRAGSTDRPDLPRD
ncbi:MAG: 2-amino-4-hydroxy-6-hydroxymethyldihydropteridine diphosphokinase [Candidatus Eisenbacteria bacterium]